MKEEISKRDIDMILAKLKHENIVKVKAQERNDIEKYTKCIDNIKLYENKLKKLGYKA